MIKSIVKEVFIIMLLVIAILLVLGILFYDYVPTTEKIPTAVVEYQLPEDMQKELNETLKTTGTQNLVQTYSVNGEDLHDYEKSNDYEKGKPNPFAPTVTNEVSTNNTSNTNNINNNGGSNGTTQGTTNSGSFLNEVK